MFMPWIKKETAYLQRVFILVYRNVKVIKIHQDFPELRLQMYCHLFYGSQCTSVAIRTGLKFHSLLCRTLFPKLITRVPSNLRPTTHECMHSVMHGHFPSRDKDGCHTIQSAIAENPHAAHKFCGCMFYVAGVIAEQSFILWEWDYGPFLPLWPWPWLDNRHICIWMTHIPSRYARCAEMSLLC